MDMTNTKYDPLPQPEDFPELQLEHDLWELGCTAKRLLAAGMPDKFHDLLDLLVRGLQGCDRCKATYGHRHYEGCGILGGSTVLRSDLSAYVAGGEPQRETEAF